MIPAYPFDWYSHMGLNLGELTAIGVSQCHQLGQSLRMRYLDPKSPERISGISQNYNSRDYNFFSTNTQRTIVSALVSKYIDDFY